MAKPATTVVTTNLSYGWTARHDWSAAYQNPLGISLLGLLVVIAGFVLLVTRRYPRELFSLILGINRWVYRVLTYVALMRDEYPPFRLDQGPRDPGNVPADDPVGTAEPTNSAV